MRDDFNKDAMREKVKKNVDAGWTINGMKIALREEQIACMEKIAIAEARIAELRDQIEFLDQEYVESNKVLS